MHALAGLLVVAALGCIDLLAVTASDPINMGCIVAANVMGIGVAGWLFVYPETGWAWRTLGITSAATGAAGAIGIIAVYFQ